MRCGASSSTTARGSAASALHRGVALAGLARQEAGEHEAAASLARRHGPAALSSVVTLLAPGSGSTRWPAARTAATSRAPGSLTAGVPASLT